MKPLWIVPLILLSATASQADAKLVTRAVDYTLDDTALQGYLAYDDGATGKRPGVLLVHEWWGLNDYIKKRAEQLAALGYVAFALDMYGKGIATSDPNEAAQLAGSVKGKPLMRERAAAGLKVLKANTLVDPKRIAAIGFCFGGTTVLELAYSGADVAGVVSFHGGLTVPKREDMGNIKAKFLVLHGAEDPLVTREEVEAFQDAMIQSAVDWQMILYGGAVHSFSNPGAGAANIKGVAYHALVAERAWNHMRLFFDEIFADKVQPKARKKAS